MNKFKKSFLVIAAALFILGSCNEKEEKIFRIELSQKEAYDFPLATSNNYTVTPLSVTITNTGNQPTGPLAISLSGANANAFVLSTTTLLLNAGKSSAFTVEPEMGLDMGIYNATVMVSGGNGIVTQSFNVRFEINVFGIDLSQKGVYEFPAATTADYTATPLSVTVTNIGNQPTGALTVALSGAGAEGFSLLETAIASIAVGGTATFSVAPKTGLSLPEYIATVTVSGGANLTAKSFDVRFSVNNFAIELSRTDAYEFPSVTVGDYTVTPLSVTITNSGYLSTGQLTVALSGDNADDFSLSETAIASIAVGSTATFTVAPKTGLTVGEYAATVTVSGNSSITAKSFDVQFEVEREHIAVVEIAYRNGGVDLWSLFDDGPVTPGVAKPLRYVYRCDLHTYEDRNGQTGVNYEFPIVLSNNVTHRLANTNFWVPGTRLSGSLAGASAEGPSLYYPGCGGRETWIPFPVYVTFDMGRKAVYTKMNFGARQRVPVYSAPLPVDFVIWGTNNPKTIEEVECPHGIHPKGSREANQAYWSSWQLRNTSNELVINGADKWKEDWVKLAVCALRLSSGEKYNPHGEASNLEVPGLTAEDIAKYQSSGYDFDFNMGVTEGYRYLRWEILDTNTRVPEFNICTLYYWGNYVE